MLCVRQNTLFCVLLGLREAPAAAGVQLAPSVLHNSEQHENFNQTAANLAGHGRVEKLVMEARSGGLCLCL